MIDAMIPRHQPRLPFPKPEGRPACIAHRGAQAHAVENTLRAYEIAADLGADMWEIDLRLTADGVPVSCHDASTAHVFGPDLQISETPFADLRAAVPGVPTLDEILTLAKARGCGLYIELKAPGAGPAALPLLQGFGAAALGSFDSAMVRETIAAGCKWPVSVLVRIGEDPLERAAESGADTVHLCWERAGDRPQDLVTPDLLAALGARDLGLVLWHEERPSVLADLEKLPALGICTDQPELMRGRRPGEFPEVQFVCHRGMNHIAPENTEAAALLAYDMGCDWLELDVHETADGEIVVHHDSSVDRCSDGSGAIAGMTLAELKALDIGSWKDAHFAGQRMQTLREAITLCQSLGKRMYIENKAASVEKIWALVCEMGFQRDCFFWCGDMGWMTALRALAPEALIKSNISRHASVEQMIDEVAPQICEIMLDRWDREAPLCRKRGIIPMLQYFGAPDRAVFDRIAALRPEMINLDRADLLLEALRRQGQAEGHRPSEVA
ncbi:glycerophosphodiester phosphodiesterase family protein [Oceanicola sp. S124]|uniref:glycerophosphodiester phosphodiesterase family protein n=1 Tax=Oceanicola sp. S124 TaxID=1042378 RepID=UPI0002557E8C|nr:glycerophosphodiester phosphodiesterase family protein [Oceanicola sp. S124]